MPLTTFHCFQIGDLTLNTQLGTLYRGDQEIPLPQLSYKMLCILVEQAPAIVSQDELITAVWQDQVVSDETLKQRIKLLRQALDDKPQTPKYIASVRGRGYRCIANITQKTIEKPIMHDSINLRLHDRLPVNFMAASNEYWRMVRLLFLVILTVFTTVITINLFTPPPKQITTPVATSNQQLSTAKPVESKALTAYQQGRKFYLRYQSLDNEMAIKSYLRAIELDPDFAPAYAGLANAYSQGVFQFSASETWGEKALAAAYDAVMLDDQSAQSYKALGTAHYVNGHISQALSANLKAVSLDANYIEAQANLGYLYSERGQLQKALERHKIIHQLDEKHHLNWFHQALTYTRMGKFSLAEPWFKKMQQARPNYHLSTLHYSHWMMQQGHFTQALQLLETAEQQSPDSLNLVKGLAHWHLMQQQVEAAKPWLHKLKLLSKGENRQYAELLLLLSEQPIDSNKLQTWYQTHTTAYNERPIASIQLAIAATNLVRFDDAFRHLTQAIELGWRDKFYIDNLPMLAPLRTLPKYQRIKQLLQGKRN